MKSLGVSACAASFAAWLDRRSTGRRPGDDESNGLATIPDVPKVPPVLLAVK